MNLRKVAGNYLGLLLMRKQVSMLDWVWLKWVGQNIYK
jgi:hypothetical protein